MSQAAQAKWMQWGDIPWLASSDDTAATAQLCDRMLHAVLDAASTAEFLQTALHEVASELSAQWAGLCRRSPQWATQSECGRHPLSSLPLQVFDEVLDREAAGISAVESAEGWSVIAVPLAGSANNNSLLVLIGRTLTEQSLPAALAVGRALEICLRFSEVRDRNHRRVERLRSTLEIASTFASVRESRPLLERIAKESTRLLECDRASIFVWDRERSEVVACPALGVESNTLRLPDRGGIVGEVIHAGQSIRVDDAYQDERFDKSVDESTGFVTRNLLCWPLRDADGELVGAFETINKNEGTFTVDDEESLTQLCVQAAIAIQNTREREQLIRSREQLADDVKQTVHIIGENPAVVALRATIEHLASNDLPVLILGESGTGKEVVSKALHFQGPRADHPFVAINCAAMPESLLENELFGHEKGSFTDAHETRPGKFELAERGTLFLDEIGDMSLGGQAKLLRVLEEKVVTRVGGGQPIPINVRVVAATNANLVERVAAKTFREDLYYRLSVVTQTLPPLRERPEDILTLAEYFLKQFCLQARRRSLKISAEARRRLQSHAWPGNVRELRNLMERVAFLCTGDLVESDDLAFVLSPDRDSALEPSLDMGLGEATKQFQQDFIRRSVKRVNGNMSEAARLLGVHRSNLYRKMRQLDMSEAGGFD